MAVPSADVPARLVLDAGPLIALFHGRDRDHATAVAGFRQLFNRRARLVVPLPIVFEVYKWLLREADPEAAQVGLQVMLQTLDVQYPVEGVLEELIGVIASMPTWRGSLEDALVAVTGLRLDVPVWALDYRDLSAFRNLHFWTPGPA